MPGREREWEDAFARALDYAVAIGGRSVHCMAGCVAPHLRPAAEQVFIQNLARAAETAAAAGIMLLIEPINPRDRPDYFLTRSSMQRTSSAKSAATACASSSIFITRRSSAAI